MDWKEQLQEAKNLFDNGLISEDEYNQMRKEALESRSSSSISSINKGGANPLDGSHQTIIQAHTPLSLSKNPLENHGTVVDSFAAIDLQKSEPKDLLGQTHQTHIDPSLQYPNSNPLGGNQATKIEGTSVMRVGDYLIVDILGEGGMGTVYRGRHHNAEFAKQGKDVAIKLMKSELSKDPSFRSRFIREAAIGQKIKHKNIAQCIGFVDDGEHLALIMTFIDGKELTSHIVNEGLSIKKTVKLLYPVAEALDHLHKKGIIHRDIKPENIKLTQEGLPIILDMGIAKDTSSVVESKTKTSTGMGTLPYMAPEQFRDAKNVDGKADQYALGIIVYQMLSGRLPWEKHTSEFDIGMFKALNKLKPLKEVLEISDVVSDILMKVLSSDKTKRFPTCLDFILELKKISEYEKGTSESSKPEKKHKKFTSAYDTFQKNVEGFQSTSVASIDSIEADSVGKWIQRGNTYPYDEDIWKQIDSAEHKIKYRLLASKVETHWKEISYKEMLQIVNDGVEEKDIEIQLEGGKQQTLTLDKHKLFQDFKKRVNTIDLSKEDLSTTKTEKALSDDRSGARSSLIVQTDYIRKMAAKRKKAEQEKALQAEPNYKYYLHFGGKTNKKLYSVEDIVSVVTNNPNHTYYVKRDLNSNTWTKVQDVPEIWSRVTSLMKQRGTDQKQHTVLKYNYRRDGQVSKNLFDKAQIASRIKEDLSKNYKSLYIKQEGTEEWKRVESVPEIWNLIPLYNYKRDRDYGTMSISAIVKEVRTYPSAEHYVWKKGFPNWTLVQQVPEISKYLKEEKGNSTRENEKDKIASRVKQQSASEEKAAFISETRFVGLGMRGRSGNSSTNRTQNTSVSQDVPLKRAPNKNYFWKADGEEKSGSQTIMRMIRWIQSGIYNQILIRKTTHEKWIDLIKHPDASEYVGNKNEQQDVLSDVPFKKALNKTYFWKADGQEKSGSQGISRLVKWIRDGRYKQILIRKTTHEKWIDLMKHEDGIAFIRTEQEKRQQNTTPSQPSIQKLPEGYFQLKIRSKKGKMTHQRCTEKILQYINKFPIDYFWINEYTGDQHWVLAKNHPRFHHLFAHRRRQPSPQPVETSPRPHIQNPDPVAPPPPPVSSDKYEESILQVVYDVKAMVMPLQGNASVGEAFETFDKKFLHLVEPFLDQYVEEGDDMDDYAFVDWIRLRYIPLLDAIVAFYSEIRYLLQEREDPVLRPFCDNLQTQLYEKIRNECKEYDWFDIQVVIPFETLFHPLKFETDTEGIVRSDLCDRIHKILTVGIEDESGQLSKLPIVVTGP